MKANEIIFEPDQIRQNYNKRPVMVFNNELQAKAWIYTNPENDFLIIFAKSIFFIDDMHLNLKNNVLVIQVAVKMAVQGSHRIQKVQNKTYMFFNSEYALIKSATIFLPENTRYNIVSNNNISGNLIMIVVRKFSDSK